MDRINAEAGGAEVSTHASVRRRQDGKREEAVLRRFQLTPP